MLIGLNEILADAEAHQSAVGAFDTPNFECLNAVIHAAEALRLPVIISHAELHEGVSHLADIGPAMVTAAKRASVPVCVHLDHCMTLAYLRQAIDIGFTGVMYDGSTLPYAENLSMTKQAVAAAHERGVDVEAELGALPARDGKASGPVYTDPEEAAAFAGETGIDALAPSFGTAHGIYHEAPRIDFARIAAIAERTGLPLVMHGGSGVSADGYRECIKNGIRKINYYTYMSYAGTRAVKELLRQKDVTYFHDLAFAAENAMRQDAENAMRIFRMDRS